MKIYQYKEGKQAQKNFEQGMKALFQIPKDAVPGKTKTRKSEAKRTRKATKKTTKEGQCNG